MDNTAPRTRPTATAITAQATNTASHHTIGHSSKRCSFFVVRPTAARNIGAGVPDLADHLHVAWPSSRRPRDGVPESAVRTDRTPHGDGQGEIRHAVARLLFEALE